MRYISFKFKRFTYEIYNCPGRWMTAEALSDLQKRLTGIAVRRLGSRPNYSFFIDARALDNKVVTVCSREGTDYCFNAMARIGKYRNRPVVHLGAVYSIEGNRGQMQLLYLWSSLFLLISHQFRSMYITSLTHTPKIFGAVASSYNRVFPAGRPGEAPAGFHFAIRDILMDTYVQECNLAHPPRIDDNFVLKGFRIQKDGSLLYPDTPESVPKHRREAYNNHLLSCLRYDQGDEILQVGVMRFVDLFTNLRVFGKGGCIRIRNVFSNLNPFRRRNWREVAAARNA